MPISLAVCSQKSLLLDVQSKPQLGQNIKIKLKIRKVKKRSIRHRTVPNKRLAVKLSNGRYASGRIWLPNESDGIENHQIHISYSDLKAPKVWYDTTFRLDYSGHIFADFSGKDGADGTSEGSFISLLFSLIGRDGDDGDDGGNGKAGGDGQHIEAHMSTYYDTLLNDTLVKTVVKSGLFDRSSTYLFNPKLGRLTISADGGHGGNGGAGEDGGDGKDARPKTEKKSSRAAGCGGDGGDGGHGAPGGDGGSITLTVDPAAKKYMHLVKLTNRGGYGGRGGSYGYGGSGGDSCVGLPAGENGNDGHSGNSSYDGSSGPTPKLIFLEE